MTNNIKKVYTKIIKMCITFGQKSPKNAVKMGGLHICPSSASAGGGGALISLGICCIILLSAFLALYFTVLKPDDKMGAFTTSDTSSYKQVDELLNNTSLTEMSSSERTFNKTNLTALVNLLSNSKDGTLESQISSLTTQTATTPLTAETFRGYSNLKSADKSIVVRLGGLDWIVTYVSNDISGNLIATLWLNDTYQSAWSGTYTSSWSSGWSTSSYSSSVTCPSNMYGTSYIRAVTLNNGGQYATSDTTLSDEYTPVSTSKFALFTMDEYGLTASLSTPNQMTWMNYRQNPANRNNSVYWLNNESLTSTNKYNYSATATTNVTDGWYTNSSKLVYCYESKDEYDDWGTDTLWLPSMAETGYNDTYNGLWAINTSERSASVYSWSRSAKSYGADCGYDLHPSGSGCNLYNVSSSLAVRPALLLNLISAVSHAEYPKVAAVTLDQQSGSGGTSSITATYGSVMPSITIPTRTGYTFGGYYTGTNGTGTQYYTATGASAKTCDLTSATTLYAKWTANTYTITLNTNGGAINSGNVTSYTYGAGATLPTDVTRTSYTFDGWYANSDLSGTAVTSVTTTDLDNKTYYAKWTANTYDIKFNLGDGGGGVSDTTYTFSESSQTMTISNPTRSGYSFSNWTISCGGFSPTISGTTLTIPANCYGTITLTANWILSRTITVAESISGVADVLTGGGSYADGTSVTLTAYAKAGYGLKYWLKNGESFSGNVANKITITADGDATYTAVFSELGVNVEEFVVASTKGGVAYVVGQDADELEDDDTVTIMTKTCLVGYEFVGWYLDNDRTTLISDNPSYRVAKSVAYKHVLVAVYREVTNSNVNTSVNN